MRAGMFGEINQFGGLADAAQRRFSDCVWLTGASDRRRSNLSGETKH